MITKLGSKGYLGPLGDDFSAIFPIAMGLLFFFGSISLTYDYYSSKQEIALLMGANVALSKAARSQIIFDRPHWDRICLDADKAKANYGVRAKMELLNFDPDGTPQFTLVSSLRNAVTGSVETLDNSPGFGDSQMHSHMNPCIDVKDEDGIELPYSGRFHISMTYPVLIEQGVGRAVATLRVTTWV